MMLEGGEGASRKFREPGSIMIIIVVTNSRNTSSKHTSTYIYIYMYIYIYVTYIYIYTHTYIHTYLCWRAGRAHPGSCEPCFVCFVHLCVYPLNIALTDYACIYVMLSHWTYLQIVRMLEGGEGGVGKFREPSSNL